MQQEFAIEVARALHRYGAPANRVEDTVEALSVALGFEAQVLVTPTSLMFAFDGADGMVRLHRSSEGGIDVGGVARCLEVATDVCAGDVSPEEGIRRLAFIAESPRPYGALANVAASAAASGSAACFLATTVEEAALACVLGAGVGVLCELARTLPELRRALPVAAALASTVAAATVATGRPASPYALVVCALILFVPGLTLTIAMTEATTGHLVAATSRLVAAGTVLLSLAVGVALGDSLGGGAFAMSPIVSGTPLPDQAWVAGLGIGAISFQILLGADRRDLPWVLGSGAAASVAILAPVAEYAATFLGAFAVGSYGRLYAATTGRPPMVVVVPGILVLVPGSIGFQSVVLMMADDVASGAAAGFRMGIVGMSIAVGLLVSGALHVRIPSGTPHARPTRFPLATGSTAPRSRRSFSTER